MYKKSLYPLLHLSTTVVANWITIEHEFDLCAMTIPGKYAAFHVNDEDWTTYTTSLMFISTETLKNDTTSATYNLTMWGCEFDCSFSFLIQLHKANSSVSVLTNNTVDNYSCLASNYTQNVIPTANITHNDPKPNDQYIFSPLITLGYCSKGLHPDFPGTEIDPAFDAHTCIDRLTGYDDGTYAANLHFGKGSSFSPDGWDVATYHLINSANTAFEYWDAHHRALSDALGDMSVKMTPGNFAKLAPPPKPSGGIGIGESIFLGVLGGLVFAAILPAIGSACVCFGARDAMIMEDVTEVYQVAAQYNALRSGFEAAKGIGKGQIFAKMGELVEQNRDVIDRYSETWMDITFVDRGNFHDIIDQISRFYKNKNLGFIIQTLNAKAMEALPPPHVRKREAEGNDNLGAFSVSLVNNYFISIAMEKLDDSLHSDNYPDLATYLSGANERLLTYFNETLYDNFFTANMSILHTFAGTQLFSSDRLIADADDIYQTIRTSTYNTMTATFLSNVLDAFKIVICDPAPSFCGVGCSCGRGGCSGTWHCPRVGNDGCVMNIASSQLDELNSLRGSSDICLNNGTGWNITHNPSCSTKLFECQNESGGVLIPIGG